MRKFIGNGIYLLFALSAITQFFLLPGVIWNLTFPYLQVLLLMIAWRRYKSNRLIKYSSIVIAFFVIAEIGFKLYSNSNTLSKALDKEIKIMTYNVFFENKHPDRSIEVIKNANPDVLVIQELTPNWATKLQKALGGAYPYQLIHPLTGTHGFGVYSKYKINDQKFLLNSSKKPFAQIVNLMIEDNSIRLINVHLASPGVAVENKDQFIPLYIKNYQERKDQIDSLNKLTENKNFDCQILAGDLNTLYSEPIFKKLQFQWVNSFNGLVRWKQFNFPHNTKINPMITLDYIMGRGKMKFLASHVIEGGSSDHLAIMARIRL